MQYSVRFLSLVTIERMHLRNVQHYCYRYEIPHNYNGGISDAKRNMITLLPTPIQSLRQRQTDNEDVSTVTHTHTHTHTHNHSKQPNETKQKQKRQKNRSNKNENNDTDCKVFCTKQQRKCLSNVEFPIGSE